ncbi:MAG TPA: glycosyltransferase [Gemmatimonadaceae bacterium]|nr:glycosyltransferase [Gemmatimonadaceae bacterium]
MGQIAPGAETRSVMDGSTRAPVVGSAAAAPAPVGGAAAPASTRITTGERLLVWTLVFVAVQAVLYFALWWLSPDHRRNLPIFIPLTFATFWFLFESCVFWTYLAGMKIPVGRAAPAGLTVDVFTTAAPGEPVEMFERSLPAMRDIRYPHRTYLLDGSGNPELGSLAERVGIDRIDCAGVGGAKAGKVNHALTLTSGEIVLVLDPDHEAEPEFLDRVLGQFEDPLVGFVQVVQAYYNQSASWIARAAAEQTYGFYGPILMGMNRFGGPLAIGANCTFRRAALDSIGGHAVHLVEDFVTSLRLHAGGWKSAYVPEIVARGLVPEDLQSYFNQQLKWATGMFQVLFGLMPRLFWKLPGWERLRYVVSSTYYLIGVAIAINLLLPIVFLFTGIWAVEQPIQSYVLRLVPFITMFLLLHLLSQRWMRHRSERGLQWRGMLLKLGTWPVYLMALAFAVAGAKVPYLPTAKTRQRGNSLRLVVPHVAIIILSLAGIVWALQSPLADFDGTRLMIVFASINCVLMLPTVIAAVADARPKERA